MKENVDPWKSRGRVRTAQVPSANLLNRDQVFTADDNWEV